MRWGQMEYYIQTSLILGQKAEASEMWQWPKEARNKTADNIHAEVSDGTKIETPLTEAEMS